MFLLIIFTALILPGLLLIILNKKPLTATKSDEYTPRDTGKVIFAIGIVFGIVSLIINFTSYSKQIKTYEAARSVNQKTEILQERYDALYTTFSKHLAEEYPAIEKEVFANTSLASAPNLNIVLTNYPVLQSSRTLMKLVDETKLIADDMYAQQLVAQEIYKEVRYRNENPWILLKKKIPEDLDKSIYPE